LPSCYLCLQFLRPCIWPTTRYRYFTHNITCNLNLIETNIDSKSDSRLHSKINSRLHSMFYNMPKKRSIKYLACMISDIYSETCLKRTLDKPKSCINRTCNKVLMQEIFVNLTCINQIPVYSEHKSWSQWGSGYMLCCV
jgi:hypothetical protein